MREHAWGRYNVLHSASDSRHTTADGPARRRGAGLTHRHAPRLWRAVAGLFVVLSSCARLHTTQSGPPPADRAWRPTLTMAQAYAARGEFAAADSALAAFATRYPGSAETLESAYWRAVFRLDPGNRDLSLETAMASLDGYLADTRPHEHTAEARTLRRIAGELDRLNRLAGNALAQQVKDVGAVPVTRVGGNEPTTQPAKPSADAQAAADEIKRLKEELAKANAELERIRRRLAQPPPPKP